MSDVYFYHLQRQTLERALPLLLDKGLQRGWRSVVQLRSAERLAAIDEALWTYADDSFLAHGKAGDPDPERQPVYLTLDHGNPNGAAMRCFVERCEALPVLAAAEASPYQRALILFDGGDEEELAAARAQWSALKGAGHPVTYWQEEDGRWMKKA